MEQNSFEFMYDEWIAREILSTLPREINLERYLNLKVNKINATIGFRRTGKTTFFYLLLKMLEKRSVYMLILRMKDYQEN